MSVLRYTYIKELTNRKENCNNDYIRLKISKFNSSYK